MENNYIFKMRKINKLIALVTFSVFFTFNTQAQVKKSSQLNASEYQKQKLAGNLPTMFPNEFPNELPNSKIVVAKNNKSKELPKTGLVHTSNKAKSYQALTSGACDYSFGYEPPILTPDTDLNGDIVTDTVVKFTNGTAPLYRNDDGSSPAMTLPFTFCFYGDTLNSNVYVNNNGNISFGASYTTFSGVAFPTNAFVMLAPFWGDVDTRALGSGVVYMRRMPHYAIFKWHRVGYFNTQDDKLNSFMLVLTDGTDVHIPNGLNVGFYYDDMQWTTGSASQGVNGFGGTPATVGANRNSTSFLQFGRFDQPGNAYDGPQNLADGVDWLDNQTFIFSSCSNGSNVAPILTGITVCDTLNACIGDTLVYNIGFLGPEASDSVTIHVIPPTNITGFSYAIDSISDPSSPVLSVTYIASQIGNVNFQIWGSDDGSPPLSSDTITVTVRTSVISGSASSTSATCLNDNGTITYNLTQGISPYTISYNGGNTQAGFVIDSLAGGTYNVLLEDAAGCFLDTSIFIFQPVGINSFTNNDGPYCLGSTINLTGGPDSTSTGATYSWTDATGTVVGTTMNLSIPNAAVANSGYYKLTITNTNGCAGISDSTEVLLGVPVVNAGLDFGTCNTDPANLNGTISGTATTYLWTTSGTGTFNFNNFQFPTYTPTAADVTTGYVNIILTSGPTGCEVSDTLKLNIDKPVLENILTTTSKVCKGGSVPLSGSVSNTTNYLWSVTPTTAGNISNANNSSAAFNAIGTSSNATITLTAISGNSCPDVSSTIPITINPNPLVTLSGGGVVGKNQTNCPDSAAFVKFTFSGGNAPFKFTYTNGTNNYIDSTAVGINTYNVPTQNISDATYKILDYKNSEGCIKFNTNVDSIKILGLSYDINFFNTVATCGKDDGKIVANISNNLTSTPANTNYFWTGFTTAGQSSDSVKHPNLLSNIDSINNIYGGKDYYLTLVDPKGCNFKKLNYLALKQGVFASIHSDSLEGISPFKFKFINTTTGDSILNYTFMFGDGDNDVTIDSLSSDTLMHEYTSDFDTTYTFIVWAKSEVYDQCDDYDTINVKVRVPVNVKTYNVLSLGDGDKTNSAFRINPSGVSDVTCLIYDRWGNKVKDFARSGPRTSSSGEEWDGVIWDNIESAAGTYYYILNYNIKKDSVRQAAEPKTGFIQILR